MTTIPIEFQEHEDSPVESGSVEGGFTFQRIFLCRYEERFQFLTAMFTGGFIGRPKAYHEDFPGVLCSEFSIERIINNPTGPAYMTDPELEIIGHDTLAKITIDYAPISFSSEDDSLREGTWITYGRGSGVEFSDVHGRGMRWESSGQSVPDDIRAVLPITTTTHEVTWHQVESPPWARLQELQGTVNSSDFYIPATGLTVPSEGLYFAGTSSRQTLRYDGVSTTELTLSFIEKRQTALTFAPYGWNHKFNPKTGEYDRPVSKSGDPLFQLSDMGGLFS